MQTNPEYSTVYWPPRFQPVIGCVQLLHDWAEHQGRLKPLAESLSESGYVVVTSDFKGHGSNIKRETELGYAGDSGMSQYIGYAHEITLFLKDKFPDVPYTMIGAGLGALVCMAYLKRYDFFADSMVLISPPPEKGTRLDRLLCNASISSKGEYHRSRFMHNNIWSSHIGIDFSQNLNWLSNDPDVKESYSRDRLCGFMYTLNGCRSILNLIDSVYSYGSWIMKNPHLKIRIIAGSKDQSAGSTFKLAHIRNFLAGQGYDEAEIRLFPGLRHDLVNGSDTRQVYDFILAHLDSLSE